MTGAIDDNPRAWFELLARQPGARAGNCWVVTDIAFPLCNSVLFPPWRPAEVDERIDAVLGEAAAREVPLLWWLGSVPGIVLDRLEARRVVVDAEPLPGMALDDLGRLGGVPPAPPASPAGGNGASAHGPSLAVRRVASARDLEAFGIPFRVGFGIPARALESLLAAFAAYGLDGDVRHYVGFAGDAPVSSATVILRDGVAGLYDVATVPEARGRGHATAITVHALREAAGDGARGAILHASPSAFGIYERLGFRTVATVRTVQTGVGHP